MTGWAGVALDTLSGLIMHFANEWPLSTGKPYG